MTEPIVTHQKKAPTLVQFKARVGDAYSQIDSVLSTLQSDGRSITCDFKYSKGSGWFLTFNAGKKRLFYLFPADGDFLLKMVLNDRALKEIGKKTFPGYLQDMVRGAKKYPEGTLLEFSRTNSNAAVLTELLRIKIST